MSLSIVIAGNVNHELMELALEKTCNAVPYNEILVFSDKQLNFKRPYKFYKTDKITGIKTYCDFIFNDLYQFVTTDQVMIIQYDGFAVNADLWSDNFLNYDILGPFININMEGFPRLFKSLFTEEEMVEIRKEKWRAGGGGFTIRSKKLLEITSKDKTVLPYFKRLDIEDALFDCEDVALSFKYKKYLQEKYNIKYAPVDIALDFAVEHTTGYSCSLGFHGWYNTPLFLSEQEVLYFMKNHKNKLQTFERSPHKMGLFIGFCINRGYEKVTQQLLG